MSSCSCLFVYLNEYFPEGEQVTDDEWDKMIADEKDRWSALQKKYEYLLKEKNVSDLIIHNHLIGVSQ